MSAIREAIKALVSGVRVEPSLLGRPSARSWTATPGDGRWPARGIADDGRDGRRDRRRGGGAARASHADRACGSENDRHVGHRRQGFDTFNISTTSSFVVAGEKGASVAKHGNRGGHESFGSFDVLEDLDGSRIDLQSATLRAHPGGRRHRALCFARSPRRPSGNRRKSAMGVRTMLAGRSDVFSGRRRYQVVGVYAGELVDTLADALGPLARSAPSSFTAPTAWTSSRRRRTEPGGAVPRWRGRARCRVDPAALGLAPASLEDLAGGTPEENAETTRAILDGHVGPRRDIVLLNAAAALFVVERAPSSRKVSPSRPRASTPVRRAGSSRPWRRRPGRRACRRSPLDHPRRHTGPQGDRGGGADARGRSR